MSDAFSDIDTDSKILKTEEKIRSLEKDFFNKPSVGKARDLIGMYNKYVSLGKGYFGNPDSENAEFMKSYLNEYISKSRKSF